MSTARTGWINTQTIKGNNMSIKKITTTELIDRVALFDDSDEVVSGLWDEAKWSEEITGEYAYYAKEAAVHIEGMWELLQEFKRRIELK